MKQKDKDEESTKLMHALQRQLEKRALPATKQWWEAYLKGVIPFRGVKMAHTRAELHRWYRSNNLAEYAPSAQKNLALSLLRQTYCEDKLAGILFYQEILLPAGLIDWREDLSSFADLFSQGFIYDWNSCDWFCVKVLGPMAVRFGEECARAIADWSKADVLWQRRAAGVAFVNLAPDGDANFAGFTSMLLECCAATLLCQERFAQTGTGWVLRELSKAEPHKVLRFIEQNLQSFSAEGLRYATAHFPKKTVLDLRQRRKTMRA